MSTAILTKFIGYATKLDPTPNHHEQLWSDIELICTNPAEINYNDYDQLKQRETNLLKIYRHVIKSSAYADAKFQVLWKQLLTYNLCVITTIHEALEVMDYLATEHLDGSSVGRWVKQMKNSQFPENNNIAELIYLPSSYAEQFRLRYMQCWQPIIEESPFTRPDIADYTQEDLDNFKAASERLNAMGFDSTQLNQRLVDEVFESFEHQINNNDSNISRMRNFLDGDQWTSSIDRIANEIHYSDSDDEDDEDEDDFEEHLGENIRVSFKDTAIVSPTVSAEEEQDVPPETPRE